MPNVYMVIPHYNRWDLTHPRLWEVYKHGRKIVTEVLVVDNGSTDEMTPGGLRWWAEFSVQYPDIRYRAIHLQNNVGFLRGANFGISDVLQKAENTDILIVMSNDVLILGDIFSRIIAELSQPKRLVGGVLYSHNTGWNQINGTLYPYLEGWLLATTVGDWKALGNGFDEQYSPSDFEDVDLSTMATTLGYELVPLNSPLLSHLGAQTLKYTPERRAGTEKNRKKFEKKWQYDDRVGDTWEKSG